MNFKSLSWIHLHWNPTLSLILLWEDCLLSTRGFFTICIWIGDLHFWVLIFPLTRTWLTGLNGWGFIKPCRWVTLFSSHPASRLVICRYELIIYSVNQGCLHLSFWYCVLRWGAGVVAVQRPRSQWGQPGRELVHSPISLHTTSQCLNWGSWSLETANPITY